MFKTILSIVVVICTSFVGFRYSDKLFKRRKILQSFVLELQKSATKIRYTSSQLSKIFENNFMQFEFCDNVSFSQQWKEMLKSYSDVLKSEDKEVLLSFADKIGTTDADGELNNIELCIKMLKNNIAEAQTDIERKSKLYKTLGFCFGITIAILII